MSAEFGSDPWLDARLRDVPLPPGMMARLEQIAATSDDELDAIVRNVPVPSDLSMRLSRISRVRRQRFPWRELAVAAAVLLLVGVGLFNVPVRLPERSTADGARFVHRGNGGAAHTGKPAPQAADQQPALAVAPRSIKLPYDHPRSTDSGASSNRGNSSETSDAASDLATLDGSSSGDEEMNSACPKMIHPRCRSMMAS